MPIYGFSIGRDTVRKLPDELTLCACTNSVIMREFQFSYNKHMTQDE